MTQGSSFEGMIVENLEVRGFHTCINSHTLVLRNSRISDCVRGLYAVRGYVEESTITGNSDSGIMGGSISIADSQIRNNGNHGVSCGRVPRIRNSSVSDNVASGIAASTVNKIESSEFRGNGLHGVSSGFEVVKILDSQFEDNGGSGVRGFRSIKAKNSSFSNNDGSGISQFDNGFVPSPGMILQGSVIAGNGLDGISQTATHRRLTLKDTVVTSNGLDAACGVSVACADVTSAVEPDLRGEATCGSSHVHASGLPGENWGVCSGD